MSTDHITDHITAAFSQSHQASLDRRADDLRLRRQIRGARAFMLASAACLSIVCAVAWVHVSYAEPRAQSVQGPQATLAQLVAETHPGEDIGDLGTSELRAKLCHHGAAYEDEARGCGSASVDTSTDTGEDTSGQEATAQSGSGEDEADSGAGTSGRGGTCSGGPIPESQMLNESGGNPNVTNSTGHFGCWQLAPEHYSGGMCSDLGRDVDGQRRCANRVYDAQGPGAWTAPGS